MFQDPQAIRLLVDDFYKSLFQGRPQNGVALADHIWSRDQQISPEENATLLAPFDAAEVETFVKAMNPTSAPGPDGLPVRFFRLSGRWLRISFLIFSANFLGEP